ncbi:MAG: hypothetical protein ACYCZX_19350 [Rhodospirillaceae bacterium]
MSGAHHTPRPAAARPPMPAGQTGQKAGHKPEQIGSEGNFPDVDGSDHLMDQPDPPPPLPGEGKDAKFPKAQ